MLLVSDTLSNQVGVEKTVATVLWEHALNDNCNLFGFVDSGWNEDALRYLLTCNATYKSLFHGTVDVKSFGKSGFIVECKKDDSLFHWMTTEAWGKSCCVFFTSRSLLDNLLKHFQKFNRVYLEDDEVVFFRYYDPRVLRVYLPTCNRKEVETFFGEVITFFAESENPEFIFEFRKGPDISPEKLVITKHPVKNTYADHT